MHALKMLTVLLAGPIYFLLSSSTLFSMDTINRPDYVKKTLYIQEKQHYQKAVHSTLRDYPELQNPVPGKSEVLREALIEFITNLTLNHTFVFSKQTNPFFYKLIPQQKGIVQNYLNTPVMEWYDCEIFPGNEFFGTQELSSDELLKLKSYTKPYEYYRYLFFIKEKNILKRMLIKYYQKKCPIINEDAFIRGLIDDFWTYRTPNTFKRADLAGLTVPVSDQPLSEREVRHIREQLNTCCAALELPFTGDEIIFRGCKQHGEVVPSKKSMALPPGVGTFILLHETYHIKRFSEGSIMTSADFREQIGVLIEQEDFNSFSRLEETMCDIIPSAKAQDSSLAEDGIRYFLDNFSQQNFYAEDQAHPLNDDRIQYLTKLNEELTKRKSQAQPAVHMQAHVSKKIFSCPSRPLENRIGETIKRKQSVRAVKSPSIALKNKKNYPYYLGTLALSSISYFILRRLTKNRTQQRMIQIPYLTILGYLTYTIIDKNYLHKNLV